MRAKKAKALRKLAQEQTIGAPEREYKEGMPRVLIRDCTRSFYKRVKKAYKILHKTKH